MLTSLKNQEGKSPFSGTIKLLNAGLSSLRPSLYYSFIALHSVIHPRQVTEFVYRYNLSGDGDRAHVFLSFKLDTPDRTTEVHQVLSALTAEDMQGFDISDDELAKSHARYMIGGCHAVPNERIFRFGMMHLYYMCTHN